MGLDPLVCDGKTLRGSAVTRDGKHCYGLRPTASVHQVPVDARALGVALAPMDLEGVLIQDNFQLNATPTEPGQVRTTTWTLRAREATEAIRQSWSDNAWIVELITTGTRKGKPIHHVHSVLTSVRPASKALLRLVRERRSMEEVWHWALNGQLARRPKVSIPDRSAAVVVPAHRGDEPAAAQGAALHTSRLAERGSWHQPDPEPWRICAGSGIGLFGLIGSLVEVAEQLGFHLIQRKALSDPGAALASGGGGDHLGECPHLTRLSGRNRPISIPRKH